MKLRSVKLWGGVATVFMCALVLTQTQNNILESICHIIPKSWGSSKSWWLCFWCLPTSLQYLELEKTNYKLCHYCDTHFMSGFIGIWGKRNLRSTVCSKGWYTTHPDSSIHPRSKYWTDSKLGGWGIYFRYQQKGPHFCPQQNHIC
jgi:hypothetical protein